MLQIVRDKPWFIVQRAEELPDIHGDVLFMDFETSSHDPKKKSINPWHDCFAAGIAIKSDAAKHCFYIPIGHHERYKNWHVPIDVVARWLKVVLPRFKTWANSNVKYDLHVLHNSLGVDALYGKCRLELADVIVLAKLVETDREYKGGYGLDKLVEWLFGRSISKWEEALTPYLRRTQDYGEVPPDIMAPYACADVEEAEQCYNELLRRLPEPTKPLWETEKKVTRVLAKTERRGMRVDPISIQKERVSNMIKCLEMDHALYESTGRWINVKSNTDMFDYVCNTLGLPVLKWTNDDDDEDDLKERSPSFDKHALAMYRELEGAPVDFFETALELRERKTFQSIFLDPYAELQLDGVIHPTVNQCVRTGRTSCKQPNMQQLNKRAKHLILARDGMTILRWDYSNIEYRYIAHYIQAIPILQRFNEDPDADFHQVVADFCNIGRQPAKTVNFLSAYGGGKVKLLESLAKLKSLREQEMQRLLTQDSFVRLSEDRKMDVFNSAMKKKAEDIHNEYHHRMPTLKPTSKKAEKLCRQRGYIQNMFGRRRHIPNEFCYKAFNALCQGAAADLMKAKMVEMDEALEPFEHLGVGANCPPVHDEFILEGPSEIIEDERFIRDATCILEDTKRLVEGRSIDISLPVRSEYGYSRENWYKAGEQKHKLPVDQRDKGERFAWLM